MTLAVAHVVTGLNVGGAEKFLCGMAVAARDHGIEPSVVCLSERGPVSALLEASGIPLTHLGMRSIWRFPFLLRRLRKTLLAIQPDLVQGWMYHGNLAATLAMRGTAVPVAWNVRQSLHRIDLFKSTTRQTIKWNARFSNAAASIIYNSQTAREQHEELGFSTRAGGRIPNGVDLGHFGAGTSDRLETRAELGIHSNDVVVLAVGRAHAIKGYDVLLQAIPRVVAANPAVRFVVAGSGTDWSEDPFSAHAQNDQVRNATTLLGRRDDVAQLLEAADVFVSSSHTEGFPNAVAEAMASRLVCVATDVGDARLLLDGNGSVVEPGNVAGLADALIAVTGLDIEARRRIGAGARLRIENEFSLDAIVAKYVDHYQSVVSAAEQGSSD